MTRPPRPAEAQLAAVLEIGQLLGSTLDLEALLELVLGGITRLLSCERATLFLVDPETGELWSKVALGEGGTIRVPPGQGIAGHVASTGEAVRVADAYSDPRFLAEVDRATGFRTRSLLAVPLRGKQGKPIGVAQALNRLDGRPFDSTDEHTLSAMASVVGIALENAQLYESLRQRNEALAKTQELLRRRMAELDLLFALEQEISAADSVTALVDAVLVRTFEALQVRSGVVFLGDGVSGTRHGPGRPPEPGQVPGEGPIRDALRWGRVARGAGVTLLAAPLVASSSGGRRVIGAIELSGRPDGTSFSDGDARLLGLVGEQLGRGIDVLLRRDEQARADRLAALGQTLSGVVHDLRTPMTVVSGYAELMAREDDPAERGTYAAEILSQIEHVTGMTRELLAFVRGERALLARRVLMPSLWKDLGATVRGELEPRGVTFDLVPGYGGAARLDEAKIRRLVTNLARNAAQAMGDGGRFSIRSSADGDTLVLEFEDTGPGLPPEVASRVFQAFATHGKQGGTGLGLAIVREVVEAHAGTIGVDSRPGAGTRFVVRLPGAVLPER